MHQPDVVRHRVAWNESADVVDGMVEQMTTQRKIIDDQKDAEQPTLADVFGYIHARVRQEEIRLEAYEACKQHAEKARRKREGE